MGTSTLQELNTANSIVRRTQSTPDRGLMFQYIPAPRLLLAVGDASHATNRSSSAIEGEMNLLFQHKGIPGKDVRSELNAQQTKQLLDSPCHPLRASAHRAKRISHSTSYANHWHNTEQSHMR